MITPDRVAAIVPYMIGDERSTGERGVKRSVRRNGECEDG